MPRVTITVPDNTPQPYRFQLDRKVVTLGRSDANDIIMETGSVSNKHAVMNRVEGGYELVDLGSTNGIKSDGLRMPKVVLKSGISLKLGDVGFDFSLTDEELESLVSEISSPGKASTTTGGNLEGSSPGLPPLPAVVALKKKKEPVDEEESSRYESKLESKADSKPMSIAVLVVFLVLAMVAFCVGVSSRYEKETGEGLLKGIANKNDVVEKAAESKKAEK